MFYFIRSIFFLYYVELVDVILFDDESQLELILALVNNLFSYEAGSSKQGAADNGLFKLC